MTYRDETKQIRIGSVTIGGGNPVAIQSMTNTATQDVEATVAQILRLEEAGCEIVRCTVPDEEAASAMIRSFRKILAQLTARENCAFTISASAGWSVKKLETSDTVESCVEISDRSLYHDKESHHVRLEKDSDPDTGI